MEELGEMKTLLVGHAHQASLRDERHTRLRVMKLLHIVLSM